MINQYKIRVIKFLQKQQLAVIATSGPKQPAPESALIAFVEDNQLCIYFQTNKHTRKAYNLKSNPYVSLVIGLSPEEPVTVQYEGKAKRLEAASELEECKRRFIAKKSPTDAKYFNDPAAIFFKVSPMWIGYSDYTRKKPEVVEIKDF